MRRAWRVIRAPRRCPTIALGIALDDRARPGGARGARLAPRRAGHRLPRVHGRRPRRLSATASPFVGEHAAATGRRRAPELARASRAGGLDRRLLRLRHPSPPAPDDHGARNRPALVPPRDRPRPRARARARSARRRRLGARPARPPAADREAHGTVSTRPVSVASSRPWSGSDGAARAGRAGQPPPRRGRARRRSASGSSSSSCCSASSATATSCSRTCRGSRRR